jgi:protein gp37
MRQAEELSRDPRVPHYQGVAKVVNGYAVWTGKLASAPDKKWLERVTRRKPTLWFVNSMSDFFHEAVPDEWLARAWAIMAQARQHRFQVLTKRPARMQAWVDGHGCPENVWLGVSVEDQSRARLRLPVLTEIEAPVRFVSAEPLLEPVTLAPWLDKLDWVIVGAESGPNFKPGRPMKLDWVRDLRDECNAAGVAFYFKQLFTDAGNKVERPVLDGRRGVEMPA